MSAAAIMLMSSLDNEKAALFFEKVKISFNIVFIIYLVFVTCCEKKYLKIQKIKLSLLYCSQKKFI